MKRAKQAEEVGGTREMIFDATEQIMREEGYANSYNHNEEVAVMSMDMNAIIAGIKPEQGDIERCRKVLTYSEVFGRVVARAKQPGFSAAEWAPLAELVAVDEFERVGAFLEVMNWQQYTEFVTQFAGASGWEGTFRRIQERCGVVYLELTERCTTGDRVDVVNSMTVYEFNAAGKIRHLDIYLQRLLDAA